MKKSSSIKAVLLIGIIILLISSIVAPMTIGSNIRTSNNKVLAENLKFGRNLYPEFYDYYNIDEIPDSEKYINREHFDKDSLQAETLINPDKTPPQPVDDPPMDSPWPMYCHDVRHTGRSPYSTTNNLGEEKWKFDIYGPFWGGPVIDEEGIIYIGTDSVYAIYPNGTLKWRFEERFSVSSTPVIDENGVIYVATFWAGPQYMWAINKEDGTLKWKYLMEDWVASSPAIGDDGSIYFGCFNNRIYALYPNGTLKWKYKTGDVVLSSPAIGSDGTVYCGSHDKNLYAFYPINGTVKWKFRTGESIRVSPCIAGDGTIYCVSRDSYLYALHSDGTMKWKTNVHAGTSPTIGQDGTIYAGWDNLYAVNPNNGSIRWIFDVRGKIEGGTPCNSIDGTIYLGNGDGSDIVAVNPDGTEKWRKTIQGDVQSAPAIGKDGTIYIGNGMDDGHLYAFGPLDPNAPSAPVIDGPTSGRIGIEYDFTFQSTSPIGNDVYYWIEWGDGDKTSWIGPYSSEEEITESHTWSDKDTYSIKARAKDTDNLWGPWSYFEVEIPRNRVYYNSLFLWFLERFPFLERFINFMIK
jgi:outer membrane protein assembly factor BamB